LGLVDLESALRDQFGFPGFRPGQREACDAALGGRDVLLVMPTGSGKSLCYQLPALLRDDLTVVVSPLVALMQDQVDALHGRLLGGQVALVNAQQAAGANDEALERAARGELRLLYVAPERFSSPGFLEKIRGVKIGLFVVDEAHCVSQWGHDFRPDYFRLADAARHLGAESLFASTATATPQVANDIVRRLGLREPQRIVTGFDRPNLSFAVVRASAHEKRRLAVEALRDQDALPAIVYAGTRAGSEEIAAQLSEELGEPALAYHAGLDRARRTAVQRSFLGDHVRIIAATNAFGMGVDKPNVRTVVHASVPASLEAYYQEAGRAGRDGHPARALLIAENRDKALHVHFIKRDELDTDLPRTLARLVESEAGDGGRFSLDAAWLADALSCGPDQLRALVGHLARAGVITPSPAPAGRTAGVVARPYDSRAEGLCRTSIGEAARARWRQYREVWAYVEGKSCRRAAILRHFGDRPAAATADACCDVCDPTLAVDLPALDPGAIRDLDDAIVAVARNAHPRVGRTSCTEILHGARTQKIERNSYDGLPGYGSFAHLRRGEILERVDELIEEGRLGISGGRYPVLVEPVSARAA
jgi:ATP-dependent DNA helicase RecQ